MKNTLKIYATIFAVALFTACNLDYYPSNSIPLVPGQAVIQTEDDVKSYKLGIYANYRSLLGGLYDIADDLMFDGFNATRNYGNRYGGIHRTDAGFTPGDEYVESFWANSYTAIKNFNIIIENAEVAPEEIADKVKYIAGEARLARAISYLRLARRFGDAYDASTASTALCVPLVLKYDQQERPKRATVQQVYDQIKADLDIAAETLADDEGKAGAEYFTIDVVKAMYANYYLDIKDYTSAYNAANELIQSGDYTLASTVDELLAEYTNDAGKEAIFKAHVALTELPNSYSEYIYYSKNSSSPTGEQFASGYLPSKTLIDAYESSDIRFSVWFDDCSQIAYNFDGAYYQNKFYVFTKFQGNKALNSSGVISGCLAPRPFTIAEMHLIAAESALNGGASATDGLAALTALQTARKATLSAALTEDAVQKEWFRETVGEGRRLECLKRWKKGFSGRPAQEGALQENLIMTLASIENDYEAKVMAADDYHFNWPIPSYEMKVNSNLEQNKGYSTAE